MIKLFYRTFLTLFIFATPFVSYSQKKIGKKQAKEMSIQADQQIFNKQYSEAYASYSKLTSAFPDNEVYIYKEAICKTHIDGEKKSGITTLKTYLPKQNEEEYQEVNFFIADGLYNNYEFDEAKEYFEKYYDLIRTTDSPEWIKDIQLKIDHNHNASIYSKDTTSNHIVINNINEPINSSAYEYSPFVTPQEDMMVFTYMGEKSNGGKMDARFKADENGFYSEDIFISYKDEKGNWETPTPISSVNTIHNESCVGISPGGEKLFIFQSGNGNLGDLYETTIDQEGNWSKITPLQGDINSKAWEGSATITQDGKTLYFTSTRFGGYGGRDIYSATLQKNGKWGEVTNLGPEINSEYDEDSPFIHPDKKTLYYSTNGTRSMGGYDIVYAKKEEGKWQYKDDLGVPINTIGDDRFYVLSADGKTAYFSRGSDKGTSDQDIFTITPGTLHETPVLTIISGKVYLDDVVTNATLEATILENNELQGIYQTSQHSDKYSMLLNPELKYQIEVKINGETRRIDTLNSEFVDDLIEINHDFYIYSEGFKGNKEFEGSLQRQIQKEYNKNIAPVAGVNPDHKIINGNDTITYHEMSTVIKKNRIDFYRANPEIAKQDGVSTDLLNLAEKTEITDNVEYKKEEGYEPIEHHSSEDILVSDDKSISEKDKKRLSDVFHPAYGKDEDVFRVQVAAYRKPENYKWGGSGTYGDVLEVTYDDGITRFTIGGTVHLNEALQLQKKLIAYGVQDAFVVAFKGDERVPLYELMNKK